MSTAIPAAHPPQRRAAAGGALFQRVLAATIKLLLIASTAGALLAGLWPFAGQGSGLLVTGTSAAAGGAFLAWRNPAAGYALLMGTCYVAPVCFILIFGNYYYPYSLVWLSAGWAVAVARSGATRWSLPPRFRVPLLLWGSIVALSWPIVALRECDFSPALLTLGGLANTAVGISPAGALVGVVYAAAALGVGLLLFDALSADFAPDGGPKFRRWVLVPLAVSALLALAVGAYQVFGDIRFFSGGVFAAIGRATGTFVDANPFGFVMAVWGPLAVAALGARRGRGSAALAGAALSLSWFGVWASGSRGAFLAAAVSLLGIGYAARHLPDARRRLPIVAAVLAAALAAGALAGMGERVDSPLRRLAPQLAVLRAAGPIGSVAHFWDPYNYGIVASRMIAEHPLSGIGIGSFTLLVRDYSVALGLRELPFDNAQNWFRQQLAELGVIGSVGWIVWVGAFGAFAARARIEPARRFEAGVLRGALAAMLVVSFFGIPTVNYAAAITFWVVVAAFCFTSPDAYGAPRRGRLRTAAVGALIVAGAAHFVATLEAARGELRVPHRAVRFGWEYEYGLSAPRPSPEGVFRWVDRHAVAVLPVTGRLLRLRIRGAREAAVRDSAVAHIRVNGRRVLERTLPDAPMLVTVPLPDSESHLMIEASARGGNGAEGGRMGLEWEFVDAR